MTEHRPGREPGTDDRPGREPVTEPVDPWPHSPYPQLELALGGARRRPRWWRAGVAGTAVLALAAFLLALAWPAAERPDTAIQFRPLEQLRQLDFAEPTGITFSQLVGDRAYLAWQQGDDLELAAIELTGNAELWRSRVPGGAGQVWGGLLATSRAVVALGYPFEPEDEDDPDEALQQRPMVVLDAATGGVDIRWDRAIYPYDDVWVVEDTVVLVDRLRGALRGLRLDTGVHRWVVPFRGRPGAPVAVVPVLAAEQLAAPSTWWGAPLRPEFDRVVMVGEDRTARLVDLRSGELVGAQGTNVAYPDDFLLAYQDRLYVAGHDGYQVLVRDLADLSGQPDHLYTAPDPDRRLAAVVPCAAELLCLLDRDGSDERAAQVRVLDVSADRGRDPQRWSRAVPADGWLVPAGDWLLVGGGEPALVGYHLTGPSGGAPGGAPGGVPAEGAAARLDPDHLLVFSEQPDEQSQELSLAGLRIGADRVELGRLDGVHGQSCSWNDAHLVCPGDEGAGIWRFAGDR